MLICGAGDCVDERFLHVNGPCFLFGVGTNNNKYYRAQVGIFPLLLT